MVQQPGAVSSARNPFFYYEMPACPRPLKENEHDLE